MFIIADSRMPDQAKKRLSSEGEILWLEPQPLVYSSIAAHPDIFFCQAGKQLICAPNIPERWKRFVVNTGMELIEGGTIPSQNYPQTAVYNALFTGHTLYHNLNITDPVVLKIVEKTRLVHVKQGYTRCNLLSLNETHFITSDKGIEKKLVNDNKQVLFINPQQIILPGEKYGFIGGACGVNNKHLFICGNHRNLTEADKLNQFVSKCDYTIIELYDGPVVDVGSIMFLGMS
ncbi:MAG: hypothetical protein CVT92_12250 [Bacteroidetes bacterium HGW-Bacteroidetes-1]|nr:MAG: hypothetical protein CVT92_12250 [Bacteroidetes bacterium HGW-Bacteroidetes-1]